MKDNIIQVDVRKQYMQDMARYSLYALFERYVPDLRDGLKPVQRRILYGMFNMKVTSTQPYKKSARNQSSLRIIKKKISKDYWCCDWSLSSS